MYWLHVSTGREAPAVQTGRVLEVCTPQPPSRFDSASPKSVCLPPSLQGLHRCAMIVRPHPNLCELLFAMRGSIVPKILPQVFVAAVLGLVAVSLRVLLPGHPLDVYSRYSWTPFTVFGVANSLFLGFRNNASYDRWWEGRKQWGAQLIIVRNLGRTLAALNVPAAERRNVLRLAVAHCHSLRVQLRRMWFVGRGRGCLPCWNDAFARLHAAEATFTSFEQRNAYLEPSELVAVTAARNPADIILNLATAVVADLGRAPSAAEVVHSQSGKSARAPLPPPAAAAVARDANRGFRLDTYGAVAITVQLDRMSGVQGACERIAHTPLPWVYMLLVHRTSYIFIVLAPFALASEMGFYTPLFNAIVAYTFFGLDELARQLESPFGVDHAGLPLDDMCSIIADSVHEALGEPKAPRATPKWMVVT